MSPSSGRGQLVEQEAWKTSIQNYIGLIQLDFVVLYENRRILDGFM